MSATLEDLERFHSFAATKLETCDEDWSLQELLDQWEIENPDPAQLHDDVLAVKAALRDLENGDRGIPFEEHIRELSARFGLESTP